MHADGRRHVRRSQQRILWHDEVLRQLDQGGDDSVGTASSRNISVLHAFDRLATAAIPRVPRFRLEKRFMERRATVAPMEEERF